MAISQQELDDLEFLSNEEMAARDLYAIFLAEYGHNVFTITSSEQTHMDSIMSKAIKYGATIPDQGVPGVYTVPAVQDLYAAGLEKGMKSLKDAVEVGIMLENHDIDDIGMFLTNSNQRDVQRVLSTLLEGSFAHLDSYEGVLEGL